MWICWNRIFSKCKWMSLRYALFLYEPWLLDYILMTTLPTSAISYNFITSGEFWSSGTRVPTGREKNAQKDYRHTGWGPSKGQSGGGSCELCQGLTGTTVGDSDSPQGTGPSLQNGYYPFKPHPLRLALRHGRCGGQTDTLISSPLPLHTCVAFTAKTPTSQGDAAW